MKKNLNSLLLALMAACLVTGCDNDPSSSPDSSPVSTSSEQQKTELKELPEPFDAEKEGAALFNLKASNITSANFDEYANRPDVHYIDLRDAKDYTPSHLEGFEMVEYFAKIAGSTDQLFVKDSNGIYQARYKESVEVLENLLPKDEVLFLMCQSGARVAQCMQLMEQYGWDMSKVYNIGGMNQYAESKYRCDNVNLNDVKLTLNKEATKNYQTAKTNSKLISELPDPRTVAGDYSVNKSSITSTNFDSYAERTDVRYIDLRNANKYTESHLAGFDCVEFFANILDQSADHSGKQLFYEVTDKETKVTDYYARYEESVEYLEDLLPKDQTLFLMCQSGGRVATCMQIMEKYGWDMNRVYNIGGMNQYGESKYRVDCNIAELTAKTLVTKKGQFTEKSYGYDYTMTAYVQADDQGKITNVSLLGGFTAPETWANAEKWTGAKDAFIKERFIGKTLDEVKAYLNAEDKLAVDSVAGATLSTRRAIKAVIAALEAK